MSETAAIVTRLLSAGTVVGDALIVILVAALVSQARWVGDRLGRPSRWLPFAIALMASSGSLFYSSIVGFDPCVLCWWQRVFMFPQVVVLGLSLRGQGSDLRRASTVLSAIGALVAAYHLYLQFGGSPFTACAIPGGASCAQRYFVEFGYVTIPTMTLTAFLLIILFNIIRYQYDQSNSD